MNFISYAQNFEDVLLFRALRTVKCGRYLDIGAQDPVADSVSLAFYHAGWRGVHVEPTPFFADRLRTERPDETVIQAAVTDKPGPMTIYEIADTGLSTGKADIAARHAESGHSPQPLVVSSIRLDQLLAMFEDDIHWMKIDVEGMEPEVLASWGESSIRPWVLVIEATVPNSQESTKQLWVRHVRSRGYREVHFDGLSRFFVHESHAELVKEFSSSPNIFDGFSISPVHFAAGEITRTYEDRLASASSEASRREEEWNRTLNEARERAEASAHHAAVAAEERDGERANVATGKAQMEIAAHEHRVALEYLIAERDRARAEVGTAGERLAAAEREHRETVVCLMRECQRAEQERYGEARHREDDLHSAVRDAEAKASALHADALEQRVAAEQKHHAALQSLELGRQAAEIMLRESNGKREATLVKVEQLRAQIEEISTARQQAGDEAALLRIEAGQVSKERDEARADAEQRTAELTEISAAREEARAEAALLRIEAGQVSKERDDARADAEQRTAELAEISAAQEEARAEAALLRIEAGQVSKERDEARAEAEHLWWAAQQADAIVKSALSERGGLWQKISESLGLSRQPTAWRNLANASLLLTDQQPTTIVTHQPAKDSELTMPTSAETTARNPYIRAGSLAELLSWHGADFVRCAYVTILGRQPDLEGEATYVARLQNGISKKTILRQLRRCHEGQLHDPGIAGLDRELRRHGNATRPFVGWFVRATTSREGNTWAERQSRILHRSIRQFEERHLQLSHETVLNVREAEKKLSLMIDCVNLSLSGLSDELRDLSEAVNSLPVEIKNIQLSNVRLGEQLANTSLELREVSSEVRELSSPISIEHVLESFG